MSMTFSFTTMDFQAEINAFTDESINLSELLDDEYQNLVSVVDAIWNDFLLSETELDDALTMGYLSY